MTRFIGEYKYTVDAKGRLNIPAKFRKAISPEAGETFVVTRAPDGCLRAYPRDDWASMEHRILSRPEKPQSFRTERLIYSTASESTLDRQGRIALSPVQLQLAGITKEVFLFGGPGYVEIWDPRRFEEYVTSGDDFDTVFFQSVDSGPSAP
ncbi:MAG: division/cell wall cluster transcriptional repressor MraZ [Chitinivibrionales bacterium]|nr:division/cell wall cluster transcriptional repressor MraZ [Chitinivibrionales bacterium]MBD3394825.1 division/cell wall cluster transcriptional repressor MraZ [Chitinivibrionales bacterium]